MSAVAGVTFTDTEAKLAAEGKSGVDRDGRQLTVNEAEPKEEMVGRGCSGPHRHPGAFPARGNDRF